MSHIIFNFLHAFLLWYGKLRT